MSNSINLKVIESWAHDISVYPPAEIFFQAPKSQEKKERRCKEICERLYRFNWERSDMPNPIGTVRETVREMVILDKMFEYNPFPPKYENVVKLVAKFLHYAYHVIKELDAMHKEHEKLNEWYVKWRKGALHIMLNANTWGADILRLPSEGPDDNNAHTKFLDDVTLAMKEMMK